MRYKLKDIAGIQTGLFAKPIKDGDIVYLQSKHFDDNGELKLNLHADLNSKDITSKHLLIPGDVLFASKGTKNFACVFESHNPPSVASTSFFVVRIYNTIVLPEFLAWFLNNPATQKILKSQAIGTSIASISKVVLEELNIPAPPIEKQHFIIKIHQLHKEEINIMKQIQELKDYNIQKQLINALK